MNIHACGKRLLFIFCTDDEIVIAAVEDDFNLIIGRNGYAGKFKNNPFNIVVTALLKLVSPLM